MPHSKEWNRRMVLDNIPMLRVSKKSEASSAVWRASGPGPAREEQTFKLILCQIYPELLYCKTKRNLFTSERLI